MSTLKNNPFVLYVTLFIAAAVIFYNAAGFLEVLTFLGVFIGMGVLWVKRHSSEAAVGFWLAWGVLYLLFIGGYAHVATNLTSWDKAAGILIAVSFGGTQAYLQQATDT